MAFLKVSGISKKGKRDFVLKDISFTQNRQQKIAIAGETGSGKSTLLKIIGGLSQPDSGKVLFEDKRVEGPEETLVAGHADIAYLSQHFELPGALRVEQVLSYANTLSDEEAHTLYEVCQITPLLARRTDQLSGGERQRIALARLLTTWPELLLLDEPFSNLDMVHKQTLKTVIHDISEKFGITCMLISHDPADMLSWADEILVMKAGQIIQQGKPEAIYHHPVNAYVAGLFGKYNLIDPAHFKVLQGLDHFEKKEKGGKLLLRPENLKIRKKDHQNSGIMGKVNGVNFFGSHYEIEVLAFGEKLLIKSEKGDFLKGEEVFVLIL